jgi:hypothetical protein
VKIAQCQEQPEVLEHGTVFLQGDAAHYHHHDVQSLLQAWG